MSEAQPTADDVVRETGWVFNNETGERLTLEQFVATGDEEVGFYAHHLELFWGEDSANKSVLEIGSGIGRMTVALTNNYQRVVAADVDAAFLERCRETVARFGKVDKLQTVYVQDGHTIDVPDHSVDLVFSYITLQHCKREDALALVAEAFRIVAPGGRVALNFRTWTAMDVVLVPIGAVVRGVWKLFPKLSRSPRLVTRFGWQANRLTPKEVVTHAMASRSVSFCVLYQSTKRRRLILDTLVEVRRLAGLNPSHWWLVART